MPKTITFNPDAQPWGVCPACLDRIRSGQHYDGLQLPDGQVLLQVYCEHRQVGATLRFGPDLQQRWNIVSPIDVLDWPAFVAARARGYAGLMDGLSGQDPYQEAPPAGKPN